MLNIKHVLITTMYIKKYFKYLNSDYINLYSDSLDNVPLKKFEYKFTTSGKVRTTNVLRLVKNYMTDHHIW